MWYSSTTQIFLISTSPFIFSSISIMWSVRNRASALFYFMFCLSLLSCYYLDLWTKPWISAMKKASMSMVTSGGPVKSGRTVSDQFSAGLRVLMVDDDSTCFMILEKMLCTCLYEGTQLVSFPIGNLTLSFSSILLRRFRRSIRWAKMKKDKKTLSYFFNYYLHVSNYLVINACYRIYYSFVYWFRILLHIFLFKFACLWLGFS